MRHAVRYVVWDAVRGALRARAVGLDAVGDAGGGMRVACEMQVRCGDASTEDAGGGMRGRDTMGSEAYADADLMRVRI